MEEKDEVLKIVTEKVNKMLNIDSASESTAFAKIGMKSINFSALINVLEDEYDIEINYMTFKKKATIKEAVDYVCEIIDG